MFLFFKKEMLAAFLLAAAAPDDTLPQPITIATPPGPIQDTARRLLLKPYADATATDLNAAPWDGTADALRKLQAAHAVDLVLLDGATLATLCKAQLLDRMDWQALGRDRFVANAATDCGAGAYLSATVTGLGPRQAGGHARLE